jgi:hypothetical protein
MTPYHGIPRQFTKRGNPHILKIRRYCHVSGTKSQNQVAAKQAGTPEGLSLT